MATFLSPADFANEISEMERRLAFKTAKLVTKEQAQRGQKIARAAASADLGGDPKFSGWRPELDTRIKPLRSAGRVGHVLMPTKFSAGPWTVAEFGRNQTAGPIVRQSSIGLSGRKKRAGRGRYRRWNGQTAGKGTASEAVAEMERKLPDIADKEAIRAMRRHFDVDRR
jgi:hypothetical protein